MQRNNGPSESLRARRAECPARTTLANITGPSSDRSEVPCEFRFEYDANPSGFRTRKFAARVAVARAPGRVPVPAPTALRVANCSIPASCPVVLAVANLYSLLRYLVPSKKQQDGNRPLSARRGTGLCMMVDMGFGESTFHEGGCMKRRRP